MKHPHDPANYPTPHQEALHERDCEIAALKERMHEAYVLLSLSTLIEGVGCEQYWARKADWFLQNDGIEKGWAK